jgi:hypothetical protein
MKPQTFYAFEVKSKVTAHWHLFTPTVAKTEGELLFEISKLPARVFETFISFRIVKVIQTKQPSKPMTFAALHKKIKTHDEEITLKINKMLRRK